MEPSHGCSQSQSGGPLQRPCGSRLYPRIHSVAPRDRILAFAALAPRPRGSGPSRSMLGDAAVNLTNGASGDSTTSEALARQYDSFKNIKNRQSRIGNCYYHGRYSFGFLGSKYRGRSGCTYEHMKHGSKQRKGV